jgi:hypothetical protein
LEFFEKLVQFAAYSKFPLQKNRTFQAVRVTIHDDPFVSMEGGPNLRTTRAVVTMQPAGGMAAKRLQVLP